MKKTTVVTVCAAAAFLFAAALSQADSGRKEVPAKHGKKEMSHKSGHDEWMAPKEAAGRPNPIPADSASLARGKKIYTTYCVACHGASGRGDGPSAAAVHPPPADLVHAAEEHPAGDLAWKIANGRPPMPPWKTSLSEAHIWDVVNYLKSLMQEHSHRHDHGGDRR